jgi:hypothetical protein
VRSLWCARAVQRMMSAFRMREPTVLRLREKAS